MRKLVPVLVALFAAPLAAQDLARGDAAPAAPAAERWDLSGPRVAIRLNAPLVRDLGIRVAPAGRPDRDGYTAHALGAEGRMVAQAPGSIFRTVESGELRLTVAPSLSWRGGSATLLGALVRPGSEPDTFTITSADGSPLFFADHQHHSVDRRARRVRLFNLDLRLAPAFAERVGQPRQAGMTVGQLEMDLAAAIPPGSVEQPDGSCVNPDWGRPDNDVALIGVTQVQQVARDSGMVAISPSAVLKNVGIHDVPWYSKFSGTFPPYNNDQHPFLVWNMYRVANGSFEQIGVSGLKHAFLTVNSNCGCTSGNILWVNCEDTYGVGTNDSSGSVGPRRELRAFSGEWVRCGSIFDTNCDGIQNSAPPFNGATDPRRMGVLETDLQTPGAQYYFDSWYLARDDVNIYNTMGWRQVSPSFNGSAWSFGLLTSLAPGPAIDAWVNPANPGPNADSQRIDTGGGHLTLAVRATDLGGGRWRYVYALSNHDFDRKIRAFAVPLPEGVTVTNVTFHDADRNPATDWVATVTPGSDIRWQGPAISGRSGPVLDWGLVDTFGFEVDLPPSAVQGVSASMLIAKAPVYWIKVPILGPTI